MGYADNKVVVGAQEYDKAKEKAGFVAGKHIDKKSRWWFQFSSKQNWVGRDNNDGDERSTTTINTTDEKSNG